LEAPAWRRLLTRIGEAAMLHLLADCIVLAPLPNHCYVQLTGRPLRPQLVPLEVIITRFLSSFVSLCIFEN
jgi:hypothetical protein